MERCLLCKEVSNKLLGNIKVNSTQWQELQIQKLIEQHLWSLETINPSSWLCTICWQELYGFHKFYTQIGKVHNRIETAIKIESRNESYFVPQLSIQETISSELIIEDEQLVIKEENYEYLAGDDTAVMQTSKTRQQEIANADETINNPSLIQINTSNSKTRKKEYCKHSRDISTNCQTVEQCNNDNTELKCGLEKESIGHNRNFKIINQQKDNFIAENIKLNCMLCKKKMETFQTLCQHFKIVHKQQGYIICCNTKYYQRNLLSDHLHQHLDPNYLKCNHCGKVLANRRSLEFHKMTHDNTRKKNYCCDTCGARFLTRHILNTHKTRHLSDEEKLFPCLMCGKKYGSKWTLINHVRAIHENITSCDICGLIVTNNSVLKRHKSVKHSVGENKEINCPICFKISPNAHAHKVHVKYVHQMGFNYKCTTCEKAFKRPRALKEHIATHTGTYLYTCTWCPKRFKASGNMKCHRKKYHPNEWEELNRQKYSKNVPPDTPNFVTNEPLPLSI